MGGRKSGRSGFILGRGFFSFFSLEEKKQKNRAYGNLPGFCSKKSSENQAVLARGPPRTPWFSCAQRADADFLLQKPDGKFPEGAIFYGLEFLR